jgi:hypothetical protein
LIPAVLKIDSTFPRKFYRLNIAKTNLAYCDKKVDKVVHVVKAESRPAIRYGQRFLPHLLADRKDRHVFAQWKPESRRIYYGGSECKSVEVFEVAHLPNSIRHREFVNSNTNLSRKSKERRT